jgi:energy-coupling factor transport system permease protein
MNDFEFLRTLPFGPYLSTHSPLHRLDPRTRILLVVLFMGGFLTAPRPVGLAVGLALALTGWAVGKVPFEPLRRGWLSAFPFLLILAMLQVFLRVGDDARPVLTIGSLVISTADLWAGGTLILRFSGFMAVLGLAAASLSESQLTRGLEALLRPLAVLRLPALDFVMAVQITLRFFPLLAQSAERIAKAQASRGADWQPAGWNLLRRARQILPIIVPLFVTSLRRAENMALAMDARGYGALPHRTSMVILRWQRADLFAFLFAAASLALMLLL